jgi:V/A-type H+-transporting ATPase subunit A
MTEVLEDFAKLKDPKSGAPLLSRTVLIANTSDMPVAAREASIYTGITLAECYRDMGYDVAVMADSTSRWAEALRELSNRLEEIPAEEGYPPYLAARLAAFYGRAGIVENLNGTRGSVTIIGAVSPQGGDFSEPVTLHTKRFVRCFWALDRRLARARHFPAINPMQSYSAYTSALDEWFTENVHPLFPKMREKILKILSDEHALAETVKLVGTDALSPEEREILSLAKTIRQSFTQQNAYHPTDTFTPPQKQFEMMAAILGEEK